jgi:hypothetical protein
MPESMTSQKRLEAAERHRQALELRKEGLTFEAIAQRLGYGSVSSAFRAVQRTLRRTLQEPADELRKLELERLDALWENLWDQRHKPHVVDRLLAIMERRAKLLGLDAPSKIDITHRLREIAAAEGLDPGEVVREAERITRASRS